MPEPACIWLESYVLKPHRAPRTIVARTKPDEMNPYDAFRSQFKGFWTDGDGNMLEVFYTGPGVPLEVNVHNLNEDGTWTPPTARGTMDLSDGANCHDTPVKMEMKLDDGEALGGSGKNLVGRLNF